MSLLCPWHHGHAQDVCCTIACRFAVNFTAQFAISAPTMSQFGRNHSRTSAVWACTVTRNFSRTLRAECSGLSSHLALFLTAGTGGYGAGGVDQGISGTAGGAGSGGYGTTGAPVAAGAGAGAGTGTGANCLHPGTIYNLTAHIRPCGNVHCTRAEWQLWPSGGVDSSEETVACSQLLSQWSNESSAG